MSVKDLIGQKFGRLTVVARGENTSYGKATWVCACECGRQKEKTVTSYDLTSGKVRSCGCLYYESNKGRNMTHGKSKTRLYHIWSGMRQRCSQPSSVGFRHYGGKGIAVCPEWCDFQTFYDWAMSHGYAPTLSIDRIDNNLGYCPENCRWVDMKIQQNNRTNNVRISINGDIKTLSEWSDLSGIPVKVLSLRHRNNWSDD